MADKTIRMFSESDPMMQFLENPEKRAVLIRQMMKTSQPTKSSTPPKTKQSGRKTLSDKK